MGTGGRSQGREVPWGNPPGAGNGADAGQRRGPPASSAPGPAAGATRAFPSLLEAKVRRRRRVPGKKTGSCLWSLQLPGGGKRTLGGQGLAGNLAQRATSGLGPEPPRGLIRGHVGRFCRRPLFSEALKSPRGQGSPGAPSRRLSDRGRPEPSPGPQEKVRRGHAPAGAAVAAAVPEVPEGAPKLKAMSREQGTEELLPRHSVHAAFCSGGKSPRSRGSASFLAEPEAERRKDTEGVGASAAPAVRLVPGLCGFLGRPASRPR